MIQVLEAWKTLLKPLRTPKMSVEKSSGAVEAASFFNGRPRDLLVLEIEGSALLESRCSVSTCRNYCTH